MFFHLVLCNVKPMEIFVSMLAMSSSTHNMKVFPFFCEPHLSNCFLFMQFSLWFFSKKLFTFEIHKVLFKLNLNYLLYFLSLSSCIDSVKEHLCLQSKSTQSWHYWDYITIIESKYFLQGNFLFESPYLNLGKWDPPPLRILSHYDYSLKFDYSKIIITKP